MANGTIGGIIGLGGVSALLIVTSQNAYKAFLVNTTPAMAPSITPSPQQAQPSPSIDLRSPLDDRALLLPGMPVDAQFSKYGRTALMSAALRGEIERVKISKSVDTSRALRLAVHGGNAALVNALLQGGAKPPY